MALGQRANASSAKSFDPIWDALRTEAEEAVDREPMMAAFLCANVLNNSDMESAIARRVSERLGHELMAPSLIEQAYAQMLEGSEGFATSLRADLQAVYDRDPACQRYLDAFLYFKGFHALQAHRVAHWLWSEGRRDFALYLQSRSSAVLGVDINPATIVGKGVFLDHATGIVIGQTARIGDDVSILQGVTLGGTGKENGDRHPKIGNGVLIGAGANVLGNIEIGHCSKVAAGSVVLRPVPPNSVVAGVPARIVGKSDCAEPGRAMDQMLSMDD
ncbi:serine O-acetyltransferase [Notoacmeibacter sp. MSK16QG-6]|uniref:serine O-acetyltransferase n=1 Tax=Notoacmeibacter sp. MSK16QG-6 TaxID=2957982 RepID=UPI00209F8530|nr:serine O-acetyltransferase [Notoacmeibacter sp. MSK16QG-6]MCP1197865.1 serine O-acetyltransferase [Notoacmeibacter sp. MSK16QG-6]